MVPIFSKDELKRMKKKEVIQLCGYKNIKEYYKVSQDVGKVSKNDFIKLYKIKNS